MKIAHLPHAAVQHLLLYSTTTFERLLNRSSDVPPATRRAAVNTVVSLVLRRRPVTAAAPDHDGVRLEQLNDEAHVKTLHRSVERLLFALLETCFDDDETIAIPCLYELTTYAHTCLSLSSHAPANAAKKAIGRVVWTVLVGSLPRLSVRLQKVFQTVLSSKKTEHPYAIQRHGKAVRSFAQMTTYVLAQKEGGESDNSSSILLQYNSQ